MTRFSIVIPCRNERARLGACLDALDAQDHPRGEREIIIVDGGSTDATGALALARGATLLTDPGSGPAAARNVGIRHARGEIVAFTDADCVPRFDWLAKLDEVFRADPGVGGAAGALRLTRETLLGRLEDNDARLHYDGYITSNMAYRRDVLLEAGGFDESLACAEDYDLAWRILDAGYRIERAPQAVVLHDPPEVRAPLRQYLAKQFWYARHDVPAHARALQRAWRTPGGARGAARAVEGLVDAVSRGALVAVAATGIARRSPTLVAGAAGAGVLWSARDVTRTLARVGQGAREAPAMTLVESAKSAARGAGTLVGLAELARPSVVRKLRRPAPSAWPAAPAAAPFRPSRA